ncbi:MAG: twitching motility protein PilT [Chloroflexi bacterium UTCFX4]|nr:MAG: twitching motility protein PilT [Chloroflexi bacterium UTCFX4]
MQDVVSDTHALIWYLEDSPRLGAAAQQVFDACDAGQLRILIPTICIVEIIYLQEKGRIAPNLLDDLVASLQTASSGLRLADLTPAVARAVERVPRDPVSDLPDRVIVATALALDLPLITRDEKIRASNIETIW